MASPDDRRYLPTHEWHKAEGTLITIGISQFAVDELTDITYLELSAEPNGPVKAGQTIGEIESVKATSDLYCGVDGTVTEVNQEVLENPALINEAPFEKGWILKVQATDPGQLDSLLSAQEYDKEHGE